MNHQTNNNTQNKKTSDVAFYAIVIVIFLLLYGSCQGCKSCASSSASKYSSSEYTSSVCSSCHRTFTDSANRKSIRRTGMCELCFENYKYGMAMKGKDEFGNPLN